MFSKPKNPLYTSVTRRKFLELGGGAATALGVGSMAVGLNTVIMKSPVQAASSDDAKWKQYAGSKLVFLSENTPPTIALKEKLKPFYDKTGITVEIITDDLPVVSQKMGIDLRAGKADFIVEYVQDKPIGAPYAEYFLDLNKYINDSSLPQDPEGYGADTWFDNYLDISSYYYDRDHLRALPYDSAVACMFYRQDLFEQYTKDFEKEFGYRMEYTKDSTWKNVHDFASFFTKMRKGGKAVPYGYAQHQGNFAWTTQLDIQRHLFSHGRWTDFNVDDKIGSKTPGPTNWGDPTSVFQMQKFKELADVSHPDNLANGTLELNTVYQAGEIAMQVQYNEFAASVEDPKTSKAAGGKTAYAPCPKGEASWIKNGGQAVNGCNAGIAGIGINANGSEDMRRAGYLFSIWVTSTETQFDQLKGTGGTPTRKAVLQKPEVKAAQQRPTSMPNALTFDAVYNYGIKDPHFVLGPKLPEANEYYNIIAAETQKCLSNKQSAAEACKAIKKRVDNLNGI